MESLNALLTTIARDLRELTATVDQLRRTAVTRADLARLAQETTWDVNMLRQHVASKENLHWLAAGLATRRDLRRALKGICDRLAELLRSTRPEPLAYGRESSSSNPLLIDRRHERSATVVARGRVLEIEEIGAVMATAEARS